jgi:hypothetical protein
LNDFDGNTPKIGILSPGITGFEPGIESRGKKVGIPGLMPILDTDTSPKNKVDRKLSF